MPKEKMLSDIYSKLRKSLTVLTSGFIAISILFPHQVFAQGAPPVIDPDIIEGMFERFVKLSFPIAIIVATIMIIIGGYMWMISAGDPQKIKTAQGTLTWGIIGLVFLGILGLLIELVFDIFLP